MFLNDRIPACRFRHRRFGAAQNVRQNRVAGRDRIGMQLGGKAPDRPEHPVELTLGMVKPASARPAIGAAEDELVHHGWFVRVVEEFWIIGILFYEA